MERAAQRGANGALVGRYWLPVAAYAGLIFFLSSQAYPEAYLPSFLEELGDKLLHGIEYAVLGVLCYRAFRYAAGPRAARAALALAIISSGLYGATDELHQAFVPLREADPWDLVMDVAGAAAGAAIWSRYVEPMPEPVATTRRLRAQAPGP